MNEMYGYIVHMKNEVLGNTVSIAVKGAIDSWQAEEKGLDYFAQEPSVWYCEAISFCDSRKEFDFWLPACYDIIDLMEGE